MASEKFMFNCELCRVPYQHGPHIYEGRKWQRYNIMVCRTCDSSNWDGIAPLLESRFEALLREKGIALPARNAKGWYPRD
jgi:hypothetical protein